MMMAETTTAFPWLPDRLGKVFDYIDANLHGPVELDHLARLACYSSHHFEQVFGNHTGSSPIDYVRRRRMQQAANRLRHEATLAIGELGLQSGFSGYHAFAKAFHRQYGMAAGEWRHESAWRDHMQGMIRRNGHSMPAVLDFKLRGIITREPDNVHSRIARETQVVFMPPQRVISKRVMGAWKDSAMTIAMAELVASHHARWPDGTHARHIGVFHDDPGLVNRDDFVFEACVTMPPGHQPAAHSKPLVGGLYAQFCYSDGHPLFRGMYEDWLEQQCLWQLDSRRPHLRCLPTPTQPGWIAIPVRKLELPAR